MHLTIINIKKNKNKNPAHWNYQVQLIDRLNTSLSQLFLCHGQRQIQLELYNYFFNYYLDHIIYFIALYNISSYYNIY